jgi:hypothetical protein
VPVDKKSLLLAYAEFDRKMKSEEFRALSKADQFVVYENSRRLVELFELPVIRSRLKEYGKISRLHILEASYTRVRRLFTK